jgi:hypothetical protein
LGWANRNHEQPAGNNGEPDSRERKEEGFKGRHLRTVGFRLPPKGGLPFATGPKSRENLPTAAVYTIHTRVVCPIGHTEILLCWNVSARLMEDRWRVLSRAAVKKSRSALETNPGASLTQQARSILQLTQELVDGFLAEPKQPTKVATIVRIGGGECA